MHSINFEARFGGDNPAAREYSIATTYEAPKLSLNRYGYAGTQTWSPCTASVVLVVA